MINAAEEKSKLLEVQVDKSRQDIKSDRLDMSFGEIMSLYENEELIIKPEFQRSFRWDTERQSKFIESILLGIPFPPIFVVENQENVWVLIDGLQRLSTIFSFFGVLKDESKNKLILTSGSILDNLDGFDIDTIPLKHKLMIKRAVCRVEVIRIDSKFNLTFELFKRLNTGGEALSAQEIRNAIFRGLDNKFNSFVTELSKSPNFRLVVQIRDEQIEKMYYEELVLRYFTLRKEGASFKTSIQDHMDAFMQRMAEKPGDIDYESEKDLFLKVIQKINELGPEVFKLGRLSFSTSVYDAIMIGFSENIGKVIDADINSLKQKIENLKESAEFKRLTGSASSSNQRIKDRMTLAKDHFNS